MYIVRSFCSAFLMYSRIPMPRVEWKEENRRYALCFFPMIGAVIGGLLMFWHFICGVLNIGTLLFSAGAVLIPVMVTGGIHLDGFCDVNDAKACCGTKEKMLSVMSDSHIGAFAAIHLVLYLLLQAGLFSQVQSEKILLIAALGFIQSRAWSGLAAVIFQNAKTEGTLQNFSKPAQKKITIVCELFYLLLTSSAMIYLSPVSGAFSVFGGVIAFVYYRIFSYKRFGGITGDLAGYFLQVCEISMLACAVVSDLISEAVL